MSTETDKAVDMDIDYDAEVPCAVWNTECNAEATHLATHLCCNRQIPLCTPHQHEKEREWDELSARAIHVLCGYCDALPMPAPTWRPI